MEGERGELQLGTGALLARVVRTSEASSSIVARDAPADRFLTIVNNMK